MNVSNLASSLSRRLSISKFKPNFPQQWKPITANSVVAQQCLTTSKSQCRSITSSKSFQNKMISMARPSLSSWKLQSSLLTHLPKSPTIMNNPTAASCSNNLPITTTFQKRTLATKKHKRIIKMAKGYRGRAKNTFRAAIRRVEKGLQYAYRDRKMKKRNFRKLWIERINAGVRQHGMNYSRFINAMSNIGGSSVGSGEKKIMLNRKVLADLAANEPFSFKAVVDVVKSSSARK